MKTFEITQAEYQMKAEALIIGNDLLVTITGGDTPHIGTVTTWSKEQAKETVRFPSHHGRFHKDDLLADIILAEIKEQLGGNCVITSGVHVNRISTEQIQAASVMAKALGHQLAKWLTTVSFEQEPPLYYGKEEKPH